MVSRKKTTNRRKATKQGKVAQEANTLQFQRRLTAVAKNEQDEDAMLEEAIKIAATEKRALEAAADEQRQESSNDGQRRHRQTRDAALREGNDNNDARGEGVGKCWHGFKPLCGTQRVLCYEFVKTFGTVHDEAMARNEDGFVHGIRATEVKHPEAWNDILCIESIICYCLCTGTDHLLREEYSGARLYATLARYLQEVIAVHGNIQNDIYWTKVFELSGADEHTLVKFFRRRIPCSCLNEKYKEVKHVTKLGICYNPACSLPDRKTERCKLRHCTRCRQANYCSIECQKADWKSHRKTCVDWNSKNKNIPDVLEVEENQYLEKGDFVAMSKALAQEWSEKANQCTQVPMVIDANLAH